MKAFMDALVALREILVVVLLIGGAAFSLLGGIGLFRMPDLLTRMQAATKTATLGVGMIVLGVALHFGTADVTVRALLIVVFLFLTAPVAAHMIARAAYLTGVRVWERTEIDELRPAVDRSRRSSRSESGTP
jgi:multicomponent Na+:H+ antiporter subunit G